MRKPSRHPETEVDGRAITRPVRRAADDPRGHLGGGIGTWFANSRGVNFRGPSFPDREEDGMNIEPIEARRAPEKGPSDSTDPSVVALDDRRPAAQRTRRLRAEVRRLTIRETWGRSWVQDNGPATVGSPYGEWSPRR